LLVAIGIPQAMVQQDHVAASSSMTLRVAGEAFVALSVAGYFWCAALFVKAQGHPLRSFRLSTR